MDKNLDSIAENFVRQKQLVVPKAICDGLGRTWILVWCPTWCLRRLYVITKLVSHQNNQITVNWTISFTNQSILIHTQLMFSLCFYVIKVSSDKPKIKYRKSLVSTGWISRLYQIVGFIPKSADLAHKKCWRLHLKDTQIFLIVVFC